MKKLLAWFKSYPLRVRLSAMWLMVVGFVVVHNLSPDAKLVLQMVGAVLISFGALVTLVTWDGKRNR